MDFQEPKPTVGGTPESSDSNKNINHEAPKGLESAQKDSLTERQRLAAKIMLAEGAIREFGDSILRASGDVEVVERVIRILQEEISIGGSSQETDEKMDKLQLELLGKQAKVEINRQHKSYAEQQREELKAELASLKE